MHTALSIYNVFNVILKHSMLLLKYRSEIESLSGGRHFLRSRRDSNFPAHIPSMPEHNNITNEIAAGNGQMDEIIRNGVDTVEVEKCLLNLEW